MLAVLAAILIIVSRGKFETSNVYSCQVLYYNESLFISLAYVCCFTVWYNSVLHAGSNRQTWIESNIQFEPVDSHVHETQSYTKRQGTDIYLLVV